MATGSDSAAGTVTLSVPSSSVEVRISRSGAEFHVARLPDGTKAGGRDLSGALVCSASAREGGGRIGISEMELPANTPKVVKVPVEGGGTVRYEKVEVDPAELRDAVDVALGTEHDLAVMRQAVTLIEAGDRSAALEALGTLLSPDGARGMLPPTPSAPAPRGGPHGAAAIDYESMGILPAHQAVCSVSTHSPTEAVPERFAYVAFDEGRCVPREYFNRLLEGARARVPQHGGVMEEHSIGYVARQLRKPFAQVRDRYVAEVNGAGVDFTDQVRAIPGAKCPQRGAGSEERDTVDLGVATLRVDRRRLIDRHSMGLAEADAVADWVRRRVESDVAVACDRIGVEHVSAMLRSPDAVRLLVEAGVRLENAATGERMSADPETGSVSCDFATVAEGVATDGDGDLLMDWYCLRVATDDGWRVNTEDALRLAREERGPMADLRERARLAYLADTWLTTRARVEAVPTRERAQALLAHRDARMREYRLRDECGAGQSPTGDRTSARDAGARVA